MRFTGARRKTDVSRYAFKKVVRALKHAHAHLEWISYGDSYEREASREAGLEKTIDEALKSANKILKPKQTWKKKKSSTRQSV